MFNKPFFSWGPLVYNIDKTQATNIAQHMNET